MTTDKARYFTFLLYPESIPENWKLQLEMIGVPMAISPLHDRDKSNVEGQKYKKAHYHVIYVAANPVTTHSVRKRIQRALGNKSVAKVQIIKQSVENMYLYLTHESKDAIAKNKYKYDKKDIQLLNNFDIDRYVVLDVEDKDEMLNDVCDMIDEHGLANIRELRRFVKEHGGDYNLPSMKIINSVLRSHTGLIRLYFDAVYQERKYGRSYIDTNTGEVVD
ncbi:TPA: replication protein [Staphylococcus aureus]|uniref:replication protein n=1 Tax=Staphylococcus TaxID=1279 RepID=UPI00069DFFD8|nr:MULTISPECIES: replication protein [Staphylococcus]CAC8133611.1 Replication protein repB [Staphylococcus aureus]CAC8730352.1 Replication protein repB [Staphylococcus aureus]SHD35079.1 Replication protein repB [Staphylococcus aureus]HBC7278387.1 replication protein [Staphylococcus aureus]HCZ8692554.1 replication protein [Staphylococcus aureus]